MTFTKKILERLLYNIFISDRIINLKRYACGYWNAYLFARKFKWTIRKSKTIVLRSFFRKGDENITRKRNKKAAENKEEKNVIRQDKMQQKARVAKNNIRPNS